MPTSTVPAGEGMSLCVLHPLDSQRLQGLSREQNPEVRIVQQPQVEREVFARIQDISEFSKRPCPQLCQDEKQGGNGNGN